MRNSNGHSIDLGNLFKQDSKSLQKFSSISFGLLLIFTIPLMDSAFAGAPPNTIPVGVAPGGLIIVEPLQSVYLTNQGSSSISVIDIDPTSLTENEVIQTIPAGVSPHNLLYLVLIFLCDGVYVECYPCQE